MSKNQRNGKALEVDKQKRNHNRLKRAEERRAKYAKYGYGGRRQKTN